MDGRCGQTEMTVFLDVKFSCAACEELNAADVLYVFFVPDISSIKKPLLFCLDLLRIKSYSFGVLVATKSKLKC